MVWRIRLRRPRGESAGQAAADAALARAVRARREVEGARPEVARLAARLRQLRHENHFAESIEAALRGGQ